MNENRHGDPQSAHDAMLGAALGRAIRRRTETLTSIPPVAGIPSRAAAAVSAKRVRYVAWGAVAAAAAVLVGVFVPWSDLRDDGGRGSILIAASPAASQPEPVAPQPTAPQPADPGAAKSQPVDPESAAVQGVDPQPAAPQQADPQPTASPSVDPGSADRDSGPAGGAPGGPAGASDTGATGSAPCSGSALPPLSGRAWPDAGGHVRFLLEGRITNGGYELRLGEPMGGMTLWDPAVDAAVFQLGSDALTGGPAPTGVAITHNDDGSTTITFSDPATGQLLMTITNRGFSGDPALADLLADFLFEDLPGGLTLEDLLPDFVWPSPGGTLGFCTGPGIANSGYELRFDQPPGGMTLWDLTADTPLYELGPDALEGGPAPAGVAITHNDDGSTTITFTDPQTGTNLATVTISTLSSGLRLDGRITERVEDLLPDFVWPSPGGTLGFCTGPGIAIDGYELRFDQPPGGITLWDFTADTPFYELGPDALEGGPAPAGVAITHNDDGSTTITFTDPQTGTNLTTITIKTLSSSFRFEEPMPEGFEDGFRDPAWAGDAGAFELCSELGGTLWGTERLDQLDALARELLDIDTGDSRSGEGL